MLGGIPELLAETIRWKARTAEWSTWPKRDQGTLSIRGLKSPSPRIRDGIRMTLWRIFYLFSPSIFTSWDDFSQLLSSSIIEMPYQWVVNRLFMVTWLKSRTWTWTIWLDFSRWRANWTRPLLIVSKCRQVWLVNRSALVLDMDSPVTLDWRLGMES